MNETIFKLDKQQSSPATGRVCGHNPDHGRLGVHASGVLVCGAKGCDWVEQPQGDE